MFPTRSRPDGVDRGAVDVSLHMLFALATLLGAVFGVVAAVSYWHTRNVLEEAASEGVRVAAAYDGTCEKGVLAASAMVTRIAASWAKGVRVTCTDGDTVTVAVSGSPPGAFGWQISVRESAPKEG